MLKWNKTVVMRIFNSWVTVWVHFELDKSYNLTSNKEGGHPHFKVNSLLPQIFVLRMQVLHYR